jgi:hypothetical protein
MKAPSNAPPEDTPIDPCRVIKLGKHWKSALISNYINTENQSLKFFLPPGSKLGNYGWEAVVNGMDDSIYFKPLTA